MDIKEKIAELVQKITGDKDLLAKFKAEMGYPRPGAVFFAEASVAADDLAVEDG